MALRSHVTANYASRVYYNLQSWYRNLWPDNLIMVTYHCNHDSCRSSCHKISKLHPLHSQMCYRNFIHTLPKVQTSPRRFFCWKSSTWPANLNGDLLYYYQLYSGSLMVEISTVSYKVCMGLTKCWGSMVHLVVSSEFSKSVWKLLYKTLSLDCTIRSWNHPTYQNANGCI